MIQQRVLRTADRVASAFGLLDRDLDGAGILDLAQRRCCLDGFDAATVTEPLRVLLQAYSQEAELSLVGRAAARWDIMRFLSNLARMAEEEAARPALRDEPVTAPIFVTGLPRSGTTFLYRLLAEDGGHRVPLMWETIQPYPDPGPPPRRDPRPARVARNLRAFARLAPEFPSLHPFSATAPQECTEITAHLFRSMRFDTTHHVPSYRSWLDRAGHADAYRFHRRFLQHLQAQDRAGHDGAAPRRWVLKAPEHVFALDALLQAYPDAHLVFVHRDPLKVLPSVARLTEVLRAPFARRIDRAAIGRRVTGDWLAGAARMVEASRSLPGRTRVVHVHYRDLVSRPLETVAGVYRGLGLSLSKTAAQRVARLVEREPQGGYGQDQHRFADYGLDPAQQRQRFQPYVEHFRVEAEYEAGAATPEPARHPAARVRTSAPAGKAAPVA